MKNTRLTENLRFRYIREEVLNLSRKALGEVLGKNQQTIYDIEQGKINVQVNDLRILHDKLNVNPRYILLNEKPYLDSSELGDEENQLLNLREPATEYGTYIAGREDLSQLLEEVCQALPDDEKEVCTKLKSAIHAVIREKDELQAKHNRLIDNMTNLANRL